ncbi:MAG: hypothetical protein JNN07_17890 [Verrucomicrobiales bacterium]|nr:hypothetical protein [Verrucomicrobiales bacterium]
MKRRFYLPFPARRACGAAVAFQLLFSGLSMAAAEGTASARIESTNSASESLTLTNTPARSQERTSGPVRLDHASFRLISERNIFNPTRSSRASSAKAASEPRKPTKVESIALVGTMSYEKGDMAFFDGSSSEFKKALKPNDSIAGFQVQQISFSQVSLVQDGKTLSLPVGGKLRRQDDGPWEVTAAAEQGSSEASASSGGAGASEGSSSTDAGESDVLKRLLKKREQEMKNEKQ